MATFRSKKEADRKALTVAHSVFDLHNKERMRYIEATLSSNSLPLHKRSLQFKLILNQA